MTLPFTREDLEEIRKRGMTPEGVISQIEQLTRGFPFAHLDRPCTRGDGITVLGEREKERLVRLYSNAALSGRAMKFVPASGAASRMFKSLLSVQNRLSLKTDPSLEHIHPEQDPDEKTARRCMSELAGFAFAGELEAVLNRDGIDLQSQIAEGRYGLILEYLLGKKGLHLAGLPKGLIPFHTYPHHSRTAFEEQLVEAVLHVQDKNGGTRIHFTVSPEHRLLVEQHIEKVRPLYETGSVRLEITFSVQEPSTDTVAVDLANAPFRDGAGKLVFRPGGHGALLGNLDALKGDIVFIKNIDNVAPDRIKGDTIAFKKALGGCLIELQERIFSYVKILAQGDGDPPILDEILHFLKTRLSIVPPDNLSHGALSEKKTSLLALLNRPLRVCGMVRNEGEPGGGPYWVKRPDGSLSIQIVESSQVDMNSESQRTVWRSATHFNPVDLVCGLRDYEGKPFDLMQFRDPDTGFISIKSQDGRELKALELPGLWNGSMALWNTVFVEVPSSTFSPVKTILDLLRSEHRA
ncbi:MAG: DUF4301 family protein [Desulfobacteraceae bacterium]|nr:MAG: DUF4301 family protein [Desulfobacteraceae bacterium]